MPRFRISPASGRPAGATRSGLLAGAGLALALALLAGAWFVAAATGDTPRHEVPPRVEDLDGRPVDPFAGEATARVFLFVRGDCPISNRYAPEMRRIWDDYSPRGVRFFLVYPDPDEGPEAIREHVGEYGYPFGALRDPGHELVAWTGARITPEVAAYRPDGSLAYRGRIDNRWADFGKSRPAATRHDLRDALDAMLAGREVATPRTKAVGCFISDLE